LEVLMAAAPLIKLAERMLSGHCPTFTKGVSPMSDTQLLGEVEDGMKSVQWSIFTEGRL
jgi:hypothetical protein